MHQFFAIVVLLLLLGCQAELPIPPAVPPEERVELSLVPEGSLDAVPTGVRFRLSWPEQIPERADIALFEGELSSYYRRFTAEGEIPESLAERQIGLSTWRSSGSTMDAQPSRFLKPGSDYTLVLLETPFLSAFTVSEQESPRLVRHWPPAGSIGGAKSALYCSDTPWADPSRQVELAPDGAPGVLQPSGTGLGNCADLIVEAELMERFPPTVVGGWLIDPAPLSLLESMAPGPGVCLEPAFSLLDGCLEVQDDRAYLSVGSSPAFWAVTVNGVAQGFSSAGGEIFVLSGLPPESLLALGVHRIDLLGNVQRHEQELATAPAVPHITINEVYADANGPEPQQEWVELVNSGTLSVDLGGWLFEDVGGETELPASTLEPGQYALLVNESYAPDPDYDLVPVDTTLLIRLPTLGKNGLSNAGELVRLRDPEGNIVSRFPGEPPPKPGNSVARRTIWSPDGDAGSFSLHGEPGASPGAPNEFTAP